MHKIINRPKLGAARKWSEKWKHLREQTPSKELIDKLNKKIQLPKIAASEKSIEGEP